MRYATLRSYLTFIILCSLLFAGCGGESGFVDFQLTLNTPEVKGKQVTVSGGVMAQVEKIQWEGGEGQIEKPRFFPMMTILADNILFLMAGQCFCSSVDRHNSTVRRDRNHAD